MGYSSKYQRTLLWHIDAPRKGRMGYSVMVVSMVPATALMRPARGAWVTVLSWSTYSRRSCDAPREGRMGYSTGDVVFGSDLADDAPREGRMGYSMSIRSLFFL